MRGSRICVVPGCGVNGRNRPYDVKLHSFPVRDPILLKAWLRLLRFNISSIKWDYYRVCSRHFEGGAKTQDNNLPIVNIGRPDHVISEIIDDYNRESVAQTLAKPQTVVEDAIVYMEQEEYFEGHGGPFVAVYPVGAVEKSVQKTAAQRGTSSSTSVDNAEDDQSTSASNIHLAITKEESPDAAPPTLQIFREASSQTMDTTFDTSDKSVEDSAESSVAAITVKEEFPEADSTNGLWLTSKNIRRRGESSVTYSTTMSAPEPPAKRAKFSSASSTMSSSNQASAAIMLEMVKEETGNGAASNESHLEQNDRVVSAGSGSANLSITNLCTDFDEEPAPTPCSPIFDRFCYVLRQIRGSKDEICCVECDHVIYGCGEYNSAWQQRAFDHILSHMNEYLFRCKVCKFDTKRKSSIISHLRLHHDADPDEGYDGKYFEDLTQRHSAKLLRKAHLCFQAGNGK